MNNMTPGIKQSTEIKVPAWLYQDVQDDDFLMGKTPKNLEDTWEDEE